jgi:HSP20 family protein
MAQGRKSFFERLTGTVHVEDDAYQAEEEIVPVTKKGKDNPRERARTVPREENAKDDWAGPEEVAEAQLTVDVYQTPDEILVKTIVAGVRPEDLDISISRDMVTIKGHREESRSVSDEDYFHRELYWGAFSRTILLPAEIDVDAVEAIEKHGLLILKLPKVNKDRQTKVKVKSM